MRRPSGLTPLAGPGTVARGVCVMAGVALYVAAANLASKLTFRAVLRGR